MNGQLRIDQMFAFIVVDDDGTEGVCAFNGPNGPVPMVGADMARVESLRPIAQMLANALKKPVTVAKFSIREDIEVIHESKGGRV